jgi:hypothetical protein
LISLASQAPRQGYSMVNKKMKHEEEEEPEEPEEEAAEENEEW